MNAALIACPYHGLRGSASPVLTATGFVSGRWQFSTPTEYSPLDRSPKNLLLVITSATPTAVPNLVQIRPRGLLGKWVKYNEIFIYLFIPFFMNDTIRYDTRCYFNVRSKANMRQLNLPHGTDN